MHLQIKVCAHYNIITNSQTRWKSHEMKTICNNVPFVGTRSPYVGIWGIETSFHIMWCSQDGEVPLVLWGRMEYCWMHLQVNRVESKRWHSKCCYMSICHMWWSNYNNSHTKLDKYSWLFGLEYPFSSRFVTCHQRFKCKQLHQGHNGSNSIQKRLGGIWCCHKIDGIWSLFPSFPSF